MWLKKQHLKQKLTLYSKLLFSDFWNLFLNSCHRSPVLLKYLISHFCTFYHHNCMINMFVFVPMALWCRSFCFTCSFFINYSPPPSAWKGRRTPLIIKDKQSMACNQTAVQCAMWQIKCRRAAVIIIYLQRITVTRSLQHHYSRVAQRYDH